MPVNEEAWKAVLRNLPEYEPNVFIFRAVIAAYEEAKEEIERAAQVSPGSPSDKNP